jgi:hypothetical protein
MNRAAKSLAMGLALGAVASLGCRSLFKKAVPEAEEVEAGPPPTAAVDESNIPAPQDFEEEALEKVTSANFKGEFARLKKEISGK